MAGPYQITDAFDGRKLKSSHRHPLKTIRRWAQDCADEIDSEVVIINIRTNNLIDIVKPKEK